MTIVKVFIDQSEVRTLPVGGKRNKGVVNLARLKVLCQ